MKEEEILKTFNEIVNRTNKKVVLGYGNSINELGDRTEVFYNDRAQYVEQYLVPEVEVVENEVRDCEKVLNELIADLPEETKLKIKDIIEAQIDEWNTYINAMEMNIDQVRDPKVKIEDIIKYEGTEYLKKNGIDYEVELGKIQLSDIKKEEREEIDPEAYKEKWNPEAFEDIKKEYFDKIFDNARAEDSEKREEHSEKDMTVEDEKKDTDETMVVDETMTVKEAQSLMMSFEQLRKARAEKERARKALREAKFSALKDEMKKAGSERSQRKEEIKKLKEQYVKAVDECKSQYEVKKQELSNEILLKYTSLSEQQAQLAELKLNIGNFKDTPEYQVYSRDEEYFKEQMIAYGEMLKDASDDKKSICQKAIRNRAADMESRKQEFYATEVGKKYRELQENIKEMKSNIKNTGIEIEQLEIQDEELDKSLDKVLSEEKSKFKKSKALVKSENMNPILKMFNTIKEKLGVGKNKEDKGLEEALSNGIGKLKNETKNIATTTNGVAKDVSEKIKSYVKARESKINSRLRAFIQKQIDKEQNKTDKINSQIDQRKVPEESNRA